MPVSSTAVKVPIEVSLLEYHEGVELVGRFGINNIRAIDREELSIVCEKLGIPGIHSGLAMPLLMGTPQIDTTFYSCKVDGKVMFVASKVRVGEKKFTLCGFAHKDVDTELSFKQKRRIADTLVFMMLNGDRVNTTYTLAYSPNHREIDAGWKHLMRTWGGSLIKQIDVSQSPEDYPLKRLTFLRV